MERQLIAPALDAPDEITWDATAPIGQRGSIPRDKLAWVLAVDVAIADISIPDANVYYALGVRHALRRRPTLLTSS
jgi:hypothetical protein